MKILKKIQKEKLHVIHTRSKSSMRDDQIRVKEFFFPWGLQREYHSRDKPVKNPGYTLKL